MTAADSSEPGERHRRFRAPREDNRALIDPPLGELSRLASTNHAAIAKDDAEIGGWRVSEWSAASRRRMIELATEYTAAFCDTPPAGAGPLILSGHQPELFHPGVWFKNRVLDHLAKRAGGVGVHLLIDSDQCRSASIRAPRGPVDAPAWETIAYDSTIDPRPYEERPIIDHALFNSFPQRVAETVNGLIDQPVATAMWSEAVAAAEAAAPLGESLSRARRAVEQRWGATTLELPVSRLCDTPELQRAVALVLAEAPRVREAYNGALADYRRAHRLRSPAQPLPDLAADGDLIETPLWVWADDNPTRRALYTSRTLDGWRLDDRRGNTWEISIASDAPLDDAVEQIAALRDRGVKIRFRALVTTLLARLLLGDLFLHGIGGAKYDQVTDEFARRWLGLTPPRHATVTATLRLPIDHPSVTEADATRLRVRLRELEFHPERFLGGDASKAQPHVDRKRLAIAKQEIDLADRHREITAANEELQRFVADRRRETRGELDRVRALLQAAAVLDSREFSFCLYPEAELRERFGRLLG